MQTSSQVRPGRPGRSTHRAARWSLALAGILALGLAPIVSAAPPAPSAGSVTVDGDPSDWSLAADEFADLTHGGVADREVVGHLYLRYDCDTETLFGLVLLTGDNQALVSRPENAYLRIGTSGKLVSGESGNNGTPPDFAWVNSDGALADGYEVSAPLAPGSYTIRAHVLIPDDSADGYASIDNVSRATPLEIVCTQPTPTPTPTPEPTATPTPEPTATPTPEPTATPTPEPTATPAPTETPAPTGSVSPTATPNPTATPTPEPTGSVSPTATPNPTGTPAPTASVAPTATVEADPSPDRFGHRADEGRS